MTSADQIPRTFFAHAADQVAGNEIWLGYGEKPDESEVVGGKRIGGGLCGGMGRSGIAVLYKLEPLCITPSVDPGILEKNEFVYI